MPVHPRMRGERSFVLGPVLEHVGSSPHARGTLSSVLPAKPPPRFIPACAGNAPAWAWCPPPRAVHPRMRGERLMNTPMLPQSIGSSPHARGTLGCRIRIGSTKRFIPACAGNAGSVPERWPAASVHPRMRGERVSQSRCWTLPNGSSPHARGTLEGSTARSFRTAVHPRMRGERSTLEQIRERSAGSSPHARGTPQAISVAVQARRFIPACAGNARHP